MKCTHHNGLEQYIQVSGHLVTTPKQESLDLPNKSEDDKANQNFIAIHIPIYYNFPYVILISYR